MFDKPVTIIAAMARNHAIGYEGRVPWDLPAGTRRFRRLTMGCPIIVGQTHLRGVRSPAGRPHGDRTRPARKTGIGLGWENLMPD